MISFSMEKKENALATLQALVDEGYQVAICTDCEGIFSMSAISTEYEGYFLSPEEGEEKYE